MSTRPPARDDIILWLDLETTGTEPDATILEVGIVATGPGPKYETLDTFAAVIQPGEDDTGFATMNSFVTEMHTNSGLLADIPILGRSAPEVGDRMIQWLARVLGISQTPVTLAGSGIHFDRHYIRRDWPWLDERLTYWHLDVGVLRRFLRTVGLSANIDQSLTPHRAISDVFQHIREARILMGKVKP